MRSSLWSSRFPVGGTSPRARFIWWLSGFADRFNEQHVEPSLKRHKEMFGHVPELYGTDRGFFSEKNVKLCERKGVKVVCIPQCGGQKTDERKAYRRVPISKNDSAFELASKGPSPCCSAVVA